MSRSSPEQEAREFIDLDVREVSMVDRAANLRKFITVKRREAETMGAFEQDYSGADPSEVGLEITKTAGSEPSGLAADFAAVAEYVAKAKKTEKEGEDVEKALPPDLKAAMKRVMDFMMKMMEGGYPEPTNRQTTKAAKTDENEETMKARHKKEAEEMEKRRAKKEGEEGEDEEAMKARHKKEAKEMEKRRAKKEGGSEEDGAATGKNVQKSAQPAVAVMDDGSVVVRGTPVQKARGFTSGRTQTVRDVTSALLKLLKDVDEDALKTVLSDLGRGPDLPSDSKVDSEVRPAQPAQVSKSESQEILAVVAEIKKRLEAIETARSPSTSVEQEGTTERQRSVRKSFWQGVI